MARPFREPTFLPLTLATAGAAADDVHTTARRADAAAADCWTALLAGCDTPGKQQLPHRLTDLSNATTAYTRGACDHGKIHRAQARIVEAAADRDGADFAEAFISYDQAVATALARANTRLGTPTW
ncbi:sugar ABC transporter substrate-binding protein [Actinokineospora iranica]|uniref:Uncharacterized protein n=1 Tax=Actinokineospora iranica TaxID=1271860 RepID=A0A1G6RAE0_9PSEU|nr:sugar ABC transporter substrate-binding protein [Actinokineospora iranica]SDD01401.1 hypothetical protein SAMN05216174_106236 [Actinokineospora iranica]